jgi:hypothetical protein
MKHPFIRKMGFMQVATCALLAPAVVAVAAEAEEDADELSEVVVSGERSPRKVADLIPWIRRLLGEYAIEGHVDLGGKGRAEDRKTVRGIALCVGFGVAPGVQCEITARWRGPAQQSGQGLLSGVSFMTPAMMLFGIEPDERGIRYLQVDNRGLAEGSTGLVVGNTASFTTPCVDMPDDSCQRVMRITALPDSKEVDMQIDTTIDGEVMLRYRFELYRVEEVPLPGSDAPEAKK